MFAICSADADRETAGAAGPAVVKIPFRTQPPVPTTTMAAQSESTLELLQSVHADLRKEAALSGASTRVMLEKLELCFSRLRSPDALLQEAEEMRIRVRRRSLIGPATPRGGNGGDGARRIGCRAMPR